MTGGVVNLGPPSQCKQTRSINKSKQADYIVNQFYVRVFRDNHIFWLRQKKNINLLSRAEEIFW